jgi:ribosomal protein S6
MRHWLWAMALAAITAGSVQADYLIIRYNIGGKAASAANAPGTPVGGGGDFRPGGAPIGPGLQGPGFGNLGGGQPGGGPGMRPGRPGGGQMAPGMAPGAPGLGMPGGMRPGGGQMPQGPGPGGVGIPGGSGMPGGNNPFGPSGESDEDTFETYVLAVVEVSPTLHDNEKLNMKQYIHKWGYTKAYNDNATIQTFLVKATSLKKRFMDERIRAEKQNADAILAGPATFALAHGMVEECIEVLEEVAKKPELSDHAKKVIDAYNQVKANLARATGAGDAVNAWKGRLPDYKVIFSNEGHYALFYNSSEPTAPPEVERRLALLERNMKAFYLWFILKGKAMPVPADKLVAIQVNSADDFKIQRNALGDVQLVSDGFFAPRDNVVVFSTQRTDEAYGMFVQQTQTYWAHGWKREDLLKGREAPEGAKKEAGSKKELMQRDLPRMQTLALLEKALEEEAELAAVSHEGSRQLTVASGLISRVVEMPDWVGFGIGSLFETPKGPFVGVDGAAQVAFWPTYGAPDWAYIRQWKKWAKATDDATKLEDAPVALKKTVQDIYAHEARLPVSMEIDPKLSPSERAKKEKELTRAKEEVTRARAYAWSLTYYLAKYHLDELLGYFKNMDSLPPDLELDGRTLLLTFARSFKLTSAAGDVDEEALSNLAKDWYKQMANEKSPGTDIHLDAPKPKPKDQNQPGFPGAPGMPGRPPGAPGGGDGRPGGPG